MGSIMSNGCVVMVKCIVCGKEILSTDKYNYLMGNYSHSECDRVVISKIKVNTRQIKNAFDVRE